MTVERACPETAVRVLPLRGHARARGTEQFQPALQRILPRSSLRTPAHSIVDQSSFRRGAQAIPHIDDVEARPEMYRVTSSQTINVRL